MYNLIINYYFANINIKYDALDIFAEDINNFGLENINESFEEFIYDIDETFVNDFYEYSDDEDIIFKYIETSFEKYNYFKIISVAIVQIPVILTTQFQFKVTT